MDNLLNPSQASKARENMEWENGGEKHTVLSGFQRREEKRSVCVCSLPVCGGWTSPQNREKWERMWLTFPSLVNFQSSENAQGKQVSSFTFVFTNYGHM